VVYAFDRKIEKTYKKVFEKVRKSSGIEEKDIIKEEQFLEILKDLGISQQKQ
jgi:DNA-directed RNA polymerase subunit H (RpoH/RPB5)